MTNIVIIIIIIIIYSTFMWDYIFIYSTCKTVGCIPNTEYMSILHVRGVQNTSIYSNFMCGAQHIQIYLFHLCMWDVKHIVSISPLCGMLNHWDKKLLSISSLCGMPNTSIYCTIIMWDAKHIALSIPPVCGMPNTSIYSIFMWDAKHIRVYLSIFMSDAKHSNLFHLYVWC